jgi:hypothetical protein
MFTITNASSVWATLNSTFWAEPPLAASRLGSEDDRTRALQQSQFPKFGVYRVYVDGVSESLGLGGVVVQHGQAEYALATGLDPSSAYNVSLWYTTDPVFNSWPDLDLGVGCKQTVVALRTDGYFLPPPPPRTHSMLIIGDSITSGNAMFKPCDNATKCDSSQSYAGLVCEAFALNCTQLSASSKGLLHNCCDDLPVTVPVLANRTFAQDNSTLWDWSSTPFDAILIHLGTNDGSRSPGDEFTAAYLSLLEHAVRFSPRNTPIFCCYGPNSQLFAPWVAKAISQATALGMNATIVDFMAAPMDGCGHPGVKGHPAMARILSPIISQVTGWQYSERHFPNASIIETSQQ